MLRGTTQIPHRSCVSAGVALLTPVTGRTRPTLLSLFAGRWHGPLGSELPRRAFRGLFQPMRPLSWPKRAACTLFVNAFYRLVGEFYHSTPRAGLQGVPGGGRQKSAPPAAGFDIFVPHPSFSLSIRSASSIILRYHFYKKRGIDHAACLRRYLLCRSASV